MYPSNQRVIPTRHLCKIGEIVNNRYRIVAELGVGAFGHVYKATDSYGTTYALKVLHLWDVPADIRQPLIDRFEMEYRTGRINSEYLVHSLDMGFLSGNPFIVMEFCGGGDISSKMGKCEGEISKIAKEILLGLYDLHKNGKVHRDLKPENVLIKNNGTAALTDFGISGDRNKRMTERNIFGRPYQVFGTYAYMPPEQVNRARGGSTVLPTTDIFSFGVVIYQLITGKLPFGQLEDQNDLVRYQKRGKSGDWDRMTLLNTRIGRDWMRVLEGCLQPDYKLRLQRVEDVIRLLPASSSNYIVQRQYAESTIPQYRHVEGNDNKHILIRILQGEEYGKIYDLSKIVTEENCRLITLGRDPGNKCQLKEFDTCYTSRKHFTIEVNQDKSKWVIRDGQWDNNIKRWIRSSNGTYINSNEVTDTGRVLSDNDIITAGEITIRFEIQKQ